MADVSSRRARKKVDTRRLILKSARALFHQRGFAHTKLEDIALQSGVHKQTVLRYFGSKEEIALAFRQVALTRFRDGLLDPNRSLSVFEYWRNFVESSAREVTSRGDVLRYYKLVESEPALMGASLAMHMQYEDLLAEAFSREAGLQPDTDIYSRLLAGFLVAANFNIARHLLNRGDLQDYERLAIAAVDFARHSFPPRDACRISVETVTG